MEEIYNIRFSYEKMIREGIMTSLSNVQGGKFYVFASLWECFAWAAIIGFINEKRRPLGSPLSDKPFSLQTMKNNGGEKIANALICMCISKSKSLEILKNSEDVITMINEYANGGFYHIQSLIDSGENTFKSFEDVKQEIFNRFNKL